MINQNLLYDKLDEYYSVFNEIFPNAQYGMDDTESIDFMNECISKNTKATILKPLLKDVYY